jgi:hypothetical protein
MGTRSMIGMVEADGSVSAIYCNWDGYLSHNGNLLDKHYDSDVKVAELLAGGDLTTLSQTASVLLENGRPAERFDSIADYRLRFNEAGDEFRYLWDGEAWFYVSRGVDAWDDVREGLKDVQRAKMRG